MSAVAESSSQRYWRPFGWTEGAAAMKPLGARASLRLRQSKGMIIEQVRILAEAGHGH